MSELIVKPATWQSKKEIEATFDLFKEHCPPYFSVSHILGMVQLDLKKFLPAGYSALPIGQSTIHQYVGAAVRHLLSTPENQAHPPTDHCILLGFERGQTAGVLPRSARGRSGASRSSHHRHP